MQQPKAALEILNGWKEIASHLGKGVRTVQRYERELGLPIRRPAGKFTGSVMATRAELDAWVSASPVRLSFPVSQVITDHIATLTELKLRIAEMRRLRRETEELREQLRATGELLNVSLVGYCREKPRSLGLYLLSFDAKKRAQ